MNALSRIFPAIALSTLCLLFVSAIFPVYAANETAPPASETNPTGLTQPDNSPSAESFQAKGLLKNVSQTCLDTGKCAVCEIVQVGVNIGNYILAIAGAVAFFFVAWGAFGFVTARGDEEHIKEAKSTIWNALAGVILVLIAWQLVAVILVVLTGNLDPFKGVC